jgi:hypothetical protein
MASLPVTIYQGDTLDSNVAPIVPRTPENLLALWSFCSSEKFATQVRQLDQKIAFANVTFSQVSFNLAFWQKTTAEKYPNRLPELHSDDPMQWLFNGHPAGSTQPLHVAVARLIGYRWPRQTAQASCRRPAKADLQLPRQLDSAAVRRRKCR